MNISQIRRQSEMVRRLMEEFSARAESEKQDSKRLQIEQYLARRLQVK